MLASQVFKIAHSVLNPDIFRDSYRQGSLISEPIPHMLRGVWFITVEANYISFTGI